MAIYTTSVQTPLSPEHAFGYMADLRNFEKWDPGVTEVVQVTGDGPGADAAFDVTVKGIGGGIVMRYETTEYEPNSHVLVVAETKMLESVDRITVQPSGDGAIVTYEAELTLKGLLGVLDPFVKLAFNRIGGRAADGLRTALDGVEVTGPARR